jgi:hypothetical protein
VQYEAVAEGQEKVVMAKELRSSIDGRKIMPGAEVLLR